MRFAVTRRNGRYRVRVSRFSIVYLILERLFR